jgi:hypothetical protein
MLLIYTVSTEQGDDQTAHCANHSRLNYRVEHDAGKAAPIGAFSAAPACELGVEI